jgi:urease accessory protein UreH
VNITAEAGTRAVVTTTAATRVMAMDTGTHAAQDVVLHAAEDATLEYYPCVTIPFPASAMAQTTRVEAAPAARVGVVECWALGRTARDEYLQFRSLTGRTTLAVGGTLGYVDVMHLEPAAADLTGAGVLAGRRYVAAGFWYGATLDDRGEPDDESSGTLLAIGQSSPRLVYFRALSSDGPAMDAAVRAARNRATREWGPPIDLRRFHG